MAQAQAAGWQQSLIGPGFAEAARLLLGPDMGRPFVLVGPDTYSKLFWAIDTNTPLRSRGAAGGDGNDDGGDSDGDDGFDQEVLQMLADSQRCTLQNLRLIPDKTANSQQGGQWTQEARKWPELIVFAVPSPLCSPTTQQQPTQASEQHMSLVLLFNAPALGQSVKAATKYSDQAPEGRAMLIHVDPHSMAPQPNCKHREHGCPQHKACAFQGPEPAVALLPILSLLQRVIRREAETFREGSSTRRGRPSKMQQCNFCSSTEYQDHLDLYSVLVHPVLPLCMSGNTKLAAVPGRSCCQCVGSCLVLLHWLSAWPPNQADLDSRAAVVWNRALQPWQVLPLSPAWYPPMYVDLLLRDLQMLSDLVQQHTQQQQQQQEEDEAAGEEEQLQGRWQQQQPPNHQSLWREVQRARLQSGQLCYPGPLGHLELLKQLTTQQRQELWSAGFSWSERHLAACVQHLQRTYRDGSNVHATTDQNGAGSSAAAAAVAAAAAEAAQDHARLCNLLLSAVTGDEQALCIQVTGKLAAGCKQFSAIPWCRVVGGFNVGPEKRLEQLTVVRCKAQRHLPKQQAGQAGNDPGQPAGQQSPHSRQPGAQSSQQQEQPALAESSPSDHGVRDDGARDLGDDHISDDPEQYLDWRVSSSDNEDEALHWWHDHRQQQQQQQCQQQEDMGCGHVAVDDDLLDSQRSPLPVTAKAQAPQRKLHQGLLQQQQQQQQQHPVHGQRQRQHYTQKQQATLDGQETPSAPATTAGDQLAPAQAAAHCSQPHTDPAAAAASQARPLACEQATPHNHAGSKGHKHGGRATQPQQLRQQQLSKVAKRRRAQEPAYPSMPVKCGDGTLFAAAAGAGTTAPSPAVCSSGSRPRIAAAAAPVGLAQGADSAQQQARQGQHMWQSPGCGSLPDPACGSPDGSLWCGYNSAQGHQLTAGATAAAWQLAGKRTTSTGTAAAAGRLTTTPRGSCGGSAVCNSDRHCSKRKTGQQLPASAQDCTPDGHDSTIEVQRAQLKNLLTEFRGGFSRSGGEKVRRGAS